MLLECCGTWQTKTQTTWLWRCYEPFKALMASQDPRLQTLPQTSHCWLLDRGPFAAGTSLLRHSQCMGYLSTWSTVTMNNIIFTYWFYYVFWNEYLLKDTMVILFHIFRNLQQECEFVNIYMYFCILIFFSLFSLLS